MYFEDIRFPKKAIWIVLLVVVCVFGAIFFVAGHNNEICLARPEKELQNTYWATTATTDDGEEQQVFMFDRTGTILTKCYPEHQILFVKQWSNWRDIAGRTQEGFIVYERGYNTDLSLSGDTLTITTTHTETGRMKNQLVLKEYTPTDFETTTYGEIILAQFFQAITEVRPTVERDDTYAIVGDEP